jgi:hypothetical protein
MFRASDGGKPTPALRKQLLEEVRQMRAGVREEQTAAEALPVLAPVPPPPVSGSQKRDVAQEVAPLRKKFEERAVQLPPSEEVPTVLPEDVELAELGPTRRRSTKPGRGDYPRVRLGLTLNLMAAGILLLAFVIGFITILASAKAIYDASDPYGSPRPMLEATNKLPVGLLCLAALLVIGQGIDIVGLSYCLGAPRKDAARSWALVSLVVAAAGLPIACAGGILRLAADAGLGSVLFIFGLILLCAAKVLFLVFLRALGLSMEVLTLARQIYIIIFLVILAALFHLVVLASAGFHMTGDILAIVTGRGTGEGLKDVSTSALIIWAASLLILIYAVIRFLLTVNDARGEVGYHMARRQRPL